MDAERAAERDFVVRTAQENDVKFIRLWFTDILGHLKGFAITVEDLEDAIEQGVGFDGAAIEGFARIDESDMRRSEERRVGKECRSRWSPYH